jgi:hypothetical protein
MNEIFAVDPKSPQDLKDIQAMFNQFGFENGRFIANFPDDWIRLFCEHTHQLRDIEKQRFMRLLDLHKDSLIDVGLDYRRSKSWVENANLVKDTSRAIYRILATDPNPLGIETLQKFLWNDDEVNISRGAHITMSAEAYQKAIAPLVRRSTEVHLVDPFFHLRAPEDGRIDKGRQSVLRQFFIEAENSNRCEIFKIHFKQHKYLSKQSQEQQIEEDLTELCSQAKLQKLIVEFTVTDDITHGRYIFSIKGGLHFDQGFQPIWDKKNHVHWLSKAELDPILYRYL